MSVCLRRTFAVVSIGLGVMVLGMIWSIVNTALASIQKDLSATVLQLQWMMNAFGISLCVPLLTMGKLGDAYGRKKVFLWGLVGALCASILAGFANQIGILIASMALFGLSGSIILPLSQALLVHQFPESKKEKAVGLWSIFASLSLALGPIVGGIILNFWGWRWVYFINIPIILFTIPVILFAARKETEHHRAHCDWAGVGLLACLVGSFVIALMQGENWGWNSAITMGFFALSITSLCFFIWQERKAKFPLFRPDFFSNPSFLFSAIPNGCVIGSIWVAFFFFPLFLQNVKNFSAFETGMILLLITLPVAFLSGPVSKLYRHWGAKPLLICGLSCLGISALIQALFTNDLIFWPTAMGCLLLGFGWVLTWGPSISCALSSLPHQLAGVASGMFTTLQELGAIFSFTIAGVFFRMTHHRFLLPEKNKIDQALRHFSTDEQQSLLIDPSTVQHQLGSDSPIVTLLKEGFIQSYQTAFWFLVGLSMFGLLMSWFLPQKNKQRN